MQGIFINGERPRSKKAVREAVAANPDKVRVEGTSLIAGTEYDGPVSEMPIGRVLFVGPDPYRKRNFYGTIERSANGFKVT